MLKTIILSSVLFGVPIYLMICAFVRSICNNREPPKRVVTIISSEKNRDIVGDGAWPLKPSARLHHLREIEPRGA